MFRKATLIAFLGQAGEMKMRRIVRGVALAAALGCSLALGHAARVTVTSDKPSYSVGEEAVFTISDASPRDMLGCGFDDPLCLAADFMVTYDASAFEFQGVTFASWVDPALSPLANNPSTGEVDVSLFAFFLDQAEMEATVPDGQSAVFAVRLKAIGAGISSVTVAPLPGLGGDGEPTYTYSFYADSARVEATPAPEPASVALVAAGLGLIGLTGRRRRPRTA